MKLRKEKSDMRHLLFQHWGILVSLALLLSGCADVGMEHPSYPSVAPPNQPAVISNVDTSEIQPMYRRLLAVDLPTVVRVATASNLDIRDAQQRVEANRGAYESAVGAIFPIISPSVEMLSLQGAVSRSQGGFSLDTFRKTFPTTLIYWILNPGQTVYDIVASKRQLEASAQQERAVELDTMHKAAHQYYNLVLAQAKVSLAQQTIKEAEELLRIEQLRLNTGTGLQADELRADAALAETQRDLLHALNEFYDASVALAVTLHLDSTVLLVPQAGPVSQTILVRYDLSIDNLMAMALLYRPDLKAVRKLLAAAQANKQATEWGALAPQIQASATLAPSPPTNNAADTMYRKQQYDIQVGFNLDASLFGRLKSAVANEKIGGIALDRKLDEVRSNVVTAHQSSLTTGKLVSKSKQQVDSAEEALRLTLKGLKVGTALTVDVLQAEAAAEQARLNYTTAVVQFNQDQIALLAALGILDQSNFEPTATLSRPRNSIDSLN